MSLRTTLKGRLILLQELSRAVVGEEDSAAHWRSNTGLATQIVARAFERFGEEMHPELAPTIFNVGGDFDGVVAVGNKVALCDYVEEMSPANDVHVIAVEEEGSITYFRAEERAFTTDPGALVGLWLRDENFGVYMNLKPPVAPEAYAY